MVQSEQSDSSDLASLTDSIGRLADQLQIIGGTLDAIRDDLSWLTRNPLRIELTTTLVQHGTQTESAPPSHNAPSPDVHDAVARLVGGLQAALATLSETGPKY
jgi:hypothetical protein